MSHTKKNVAEKNLPLHVATLPCVCALHIVVDLGDWHVQIEVEEEDRSRDQRYEYGKRCVLEIGELNLHGTKLWAVWESEQKKFRNNYKS